MAVEARPELVGKRFLCVSGEESPEIGDTGRWPWRSGVIRAVNHRDNDSLDLTEKEKLRSTLLWHMRPYTAPPSGFTMNGKSGAAGSLPIGAFVFHYSPPAVSDLNGQQWLSHVNASSFEFTHCTEFNSFSTGLQQQQLRELTQNKHTRRIKCLIPPTEYLHNAPRTE
ncbi:hypothetical protein KUCAC02_000048 [Chaenocephalus aceratus]|nr:hypothetical protein KUCAC02_000048 [Chaenocephalus aceratus]